MLSVLISQDAFLDLGSDTSAINPAPELKSKTAAREQLFCKDELFFCHSLSDGGKTMRGYQEEDYRSEENQGNLPKPHLPCQELSSHGEMGKHWWLLSSSSPPWLPWPADPRAAGTGTRQQLIPENSTHWNCCLSQPRAWVSTKKHRKQTEHPGKGMTSEANPLGFSDRLKWGILRCLGSSQKHHVVTASWILSCINQKLAEMR